MEEEDNKVHPVVVLGYRFEFKAFEEVRDLMRRIAYQRTLNIDPTDTTIPNIGFDDAYHQCRTIVKEQFSPKILFCTGTGAIPSIVIAEWHSPDINPTLNEIIEEMDEFRLRANDLSWWSNCVNLRAKNGVAQRAVYTAVVPTI